MIVDPAGIYYEAIIPLKLENLLNEAELDRVLLARVEKLLGHIRRIFITKYNHSPLSDGVYLERLFGASGWTRVQVLDQSLGDMSVISRLADERSFEVMLQVALDENTQADIFIKMHPDELLGKKDGYLSS